MTIREAKTRTNEYPKAVEGGTEILVALPGGLGYYNYLLAPFYDGQKYA